MQKYVVVQLNQKISLVICFIVSVRSSFSELKELCVFCGKASTPSVGMCNQIVTSEIRE